MGDVNRTAVDALRNYNSELECQIAEVKDERYEYEGIDVTDLQRGE